MANLQAPQFLLSKASKTASFKPALFFIPLAILVVCQFPTNSKPIFWNRLVFVFVISFFKSIKIFLERESGKIYPTKNMKKVERLYKYSTIVFVPKTPTMTIILIIALLLSFAHTKGFLDQNWSGYQLAGGLTIIPL